MVWGAYDLDSKLRGDKSVPWLLWGYTAAAKLVVPAAPRCQREPQQAAGAGTGLGCCWVIMGLLVL